MCLTTFELSGYFTGFHKNQGTGAGYSEFLVAHHQSSSPAFSLGFELLLGHLVRRKTRAKIVVCETIFFGREGLQIKSLARRQPNRRLIVNCLAFRP
jgi:hypothetical protein